MADTKLTSLSELDEKPAAADVLYLVDVSDTTDDGAGSSFKIKAQRFAVTDGNAVDFTGGGTIELGGFTLTAEATGDIADKATAQTFTNKSLTAPTITSDGTKAEIAVATSSSVSLLWLSGTDTDVAVVYGDGGSEKGTLGFRKDDGAEQAYIEMDDGDASDTFTIKAVHGDLTLNSSTVNVRDVNLGAPNGDVNITATADTAISGATAVNISSSAGSITLTPVVGGLVTVANDTLRLSGSKTPSGPTDTGTTGMIAWDSNYIYVCISSNTWKRAAISDTLW